MDFYGYDATGSVRQLTDAAGAVTDTYAYDAFGNVVARTGSTPNALLYRAEWYDASLAMYYLRARWYRPQVGRFVTADTYEGEEDEPGSLHRYLYAGADPVNRIDPSGLANTIENAQATQISGVTTQTALRPVNTRIASRTLGQVRRGADIANDVACCLDKTWSVLDLAVHAAGGIHNPALDLIDEACQLGSCGTRRGGEGRATAKGRAAHKKYRDLRLAGDQYDYEKRFPDLRIRPDAVDLVNRIIRELKPDTPTGRLRGARQLQCYKKKLEDKFGGQWSTILDLYIP
ncbi:MAG: hypothetical protein HYS04_14105 [Acidobacteria bacterium]|nr:hypothetical protein [Acidobacteriota bacterium]